MKQIKIVHKGACRYVAVSDSARLDKFIGEGWEPARDTNGKLIIRELVAKDNRNIGSKTAEILSAVREELAELDAEDDAFINELTGVEEE